MKTIKLNPKKMTVRIEPTEQGTYLLGNKEVYQNMDGDWICKENFSPKELGFWAVYKKVAIDGKRKRLIMTFKY